MPPRNEYKSAVNLKNEAQTYLSELYKKRNVLNSNLVRLINKRANNTNHDDEKIYPCLENESRIHQEYKQQYNNEIFQLVPSIEKVVNVRNQMDGYAKNNRGRPRRLVNQENGKLAKFRGLTPSQAKNTKKYINEFLSNLLQKNTLAGQINKIDVNLLKEKGVNCNNNNSSTASDTSVTSENLHPTPIKSTPRHREHTVASRARRRTGGKKVKSTKKKNTKKKSNKKKSTKKSVKK